MIRNITDITNTTAFSPMALPKKKSNSKPSIIAIGIPYNFPMNIPMNKANIIKRFGLIPAILNQLKRFDCKKYIIKKVKNKITIDSVFFITAPLYKFYNIVSYFFNFFKKTLTEIRILKNIQIGI